MSRIPAIDPAVATGKTRDLLYAVKQHFGVTPNVFRVAAQSPAALEGLLGLNSALGTGSLDAATRASIALAVAQANSSDYCLSAHAAIGKGAGLTDKDIARARNGTAAGAKTAAAVTLARAIVESDGHADDAELAAARSAGLDDGEIVEVIGNVIVNIYTNYLNHIAGTAIDFPQLSAKELPAA